MVQEDLKRAIKEGELRRRILELAESKGVSKPRIRFGRFKIIVKAEGK